MFLWIFGCFKSVPSMFCLKLLLILNLTNAVLLKKSIFESYDGVLCAKEIHRLGPMDLKIYNLAKKPASVTRQLTKSIRFSPKLSL